MNVVPSPLERVAEAAQRDQELADLPHRDRDREHRWALWRTHTIGLGSPLLERTRILQTPLFGLYLHRHHRPDRERHLHDHPWQFASLILRGGYTEEWAGSVADAIQLSRPGFEALRTHRTWGRWSVHRIRRGEFHSIRSVEKGTLSLLLVGRRRSDWGFATEDGFLPAVLYDYAEPAA